LRIIMPKAIYKNTVIAQSDDTILLEGVHYFPPETVNREYLVESETRAVCSWKGTAKYFHVAIGEDISRDAAWCYPEPPRAAATITDHMAFRGGVEIVP
jgi:uncharacterized protein (DUF427 family)